ncbi:MAG: aminotransferase class I/II-fold pyridoxal phosphate-dependent enzyme [Candidatus Competibacteraceae bacterium]|nr:MAG: aminotransferase class I/II-fold pyridoxal phosphate-dependent enzyme [Candidatus Competibacteraceae bacterium]
MAANPRVGFIAGERELARALTDRKLLAALTTPELGERVMHQVLAEGHYRKHVERLRRRLATRREPVLSQLEQLGLQVFTDSRGGYVRLAGYGPRQSRPGRPRLRATVVAGTGQPVLARSTTVVVATFQLGVLQPSGSVAFPGTGAG